MKKRGTITLVFDDGYEKTYRNALPLLHKHAMPAVFALPLKHEHLEKRGGEKVRPYQEWLHTRQEGHEIAAHSITHTDLTQLSDEQLDRELQEPAKILRAHTLIYPGGAFDERVSTAAARYYTAGRTVISGLETIPPSTPLQLKTYNFTRTNFTVTKANLLAVWAYLTNSWLIETYHLIDDDNASMLHCVTTRDFTRHLNFISKLPVYVRTIYDTIGNHHR